MLLDVEHWYLFLTCLLQAGIVLLDLLYQYALFIFYSYIFQCNNFLWLIVSQFLPHPFHFVTISPTSFSFCHNFFHILFIVSQFLPHPFHFVTFLLTQFIWVVFNSAILFSVFFVHLFTVFLACILCFVTGFILFIICLTQLCICFVLFILFHSFNHDFFYFLFYFLYFLSSVDFYIYIYYCFLKTAKIMMHFDFTVH